MPRRKSGLPRKLSHQAEGLLGFLVTLADEQGVVELTRAQLAAARSVSISTISRAIKELLKAGEIELVKEGGGRGRPSRYRIIRLARGGGSAPRGSGGRHRPVPRALTGEVAVKLGHRELVHDPVLDPETLRKSAAEAGEVLIAGIVGFLQGAARAWRQLPTWQRTVLAGLPLGRQVPSWDGREEVSSGRPRAEVWGSSPGSTWPCSSRRKNQPLSRPASLPCHA